MAVLVWLGRASIAAIPEPFSTLTERVAVVLAAWPVCAVDMAVEHMASRQRAAIVVQN